MVARPHAVTTLILSLGARVEVRTARDGNGGEERRARDKSDRVRERGWRRRKCVARG